MNNKLKIKTSKQGGFTLLLSLLVISIILSVGFGVFDIMTKELKLSGIGRESQIAFYAADAGIECAYFWDIKHPDKTESYFYGNPSEISCAGIKKTPTKDGNDFYVFEFDMGKKEEANQKCAKVKVKKDVFPSNDGLYNITETTIESRGYNYPCDSKSSHKVERAIRVISTKTEKIE